MKGRTIRAVALASGMGLLLLVCFIVWPGSGRTPALPESPSMTTVSKGQGADPPSHNGPALGDAETAASPSPVQIESPAAVPVPEPVAAVPATTPEDATPPQGDDGSAEEVAGRLRERAGGRDILIAAADVNGDERPDIVVFEKKEFTVSHVLLAKEEEGEFEEAASVGEVPRYLERFLVLVAEEGLADGTVSVMTDNGEEREVVLLGQ